MCNDLNHDSHRCIVGLNLYMFFCGHIVVCIVGCVMGLNVYLYGDV